MSKEKFSRRIESEPPRSAIANGTVLPGRYLGFVKLKDRSLKSPMMIDMIDSGSENQYGNLKAIVRLSFGDFGNKEHLTLFLDDLNHRPGSKSIDATTKDDLALTIRNLRRRGSTLLTGTLFKDDLELGPFRTIYSGKRKLTNSSEDVAKLYGELAVLDSLHGSYEGQCKDRLVSLNLETSKWNVGSEGSFSTFPGYRISGNWGVRDSTLCEEGKICSSKIIKKANYDPFTGHLVLWNERNEDYCIANGRGQITCDGCKLEKNEEPLLQKSLLEIAERNDAGNKIIDRIDPTIATPRFRPVSGEFFGYLYIEATGIHQFMRLKIDQNKTQKMIEAVATMFYGDQQSKEFSVYQFDKSSLSKIPILEGKGDAILQLSEWNNRRIEGIWYSKSSGRLGQIQVYRNKVPSLAQDAITLKEISGYYESHKVQFNLLAAPDLSKTKNDFFPLIVRGVSKDLMGLDRHRTIEDMSLDLATGNIAFKIDDGRIATGQLKSSSEGIVIYWPEPFKFGRSLEKPTYEVYQYRQGKPKGMAAKALNDDLEKNYSKESSL